MKELILSICCIIFSVFTQANVNVRIFDTGAGLATVTKFSNGQIMVFDTGHWDHDPEIFSSFESFIGDVDIDLLILSHSDSDHIAATDELLQEYRVHRVIRTGLERTTNAWIDADTAINNNELVGLTHDINLAEFSLPHGTAYHFGDTTVTVLSGLS